MANELILEGGVWKLKEASGGSSSPRIISVEGVVARLVLRSARFNQFYKDSGPSIITNYAP